MEKKSKYYHMGFHAYFTGRDPGDIGLDPCTDEMREEWEAGYEAAGGHYEEMRVAESLPQSHLKYALICSAPEERRDFLAALIEFGLEGEWVDIQKMRDDGANPNLFYRFYQADAGLGHSVCLGAYIPEGFTLEGGLLCYSKPIPEPPLPADESEHEEG